MALLTGTQASDEFELTYLNAVSVPVADCSLVLRRLNIIRIVTGTMLFSCANSNKLHSFDTAVEMDPEISRKRRCTNLVRLWRIAIRVP